MANMIARLGVMLGIDSAEFVRGIDGATKKLEQFGDAAERYGKIAATALTAASVAALNYADQIVDVAKANDVAVDSVIKLRNALQDNGGEADNASKMLSSFVGFVDKAASGSFEAQKTMSRLGVSFKDLGTLSIDELKNKVAVALQNIEDPITRNALAMEVFGKAAKGVDFLNFADGLTKTNALASAQAKAFQDAADVVGYFEVEARNAAVTLVSELGPPLKATIDYFKDMKSEGNILANSLKVVFQTLAIELSNVQFVIAGIYRQTMQTMLFFKAFIPGTNVEGQFSKYLDEAERERAKLDEFQRRILGGGGARGGGVSDFVDPRLPQSDKPSGPQRETTLGKSPAQLEADREAKRLRENELKIGEMRNRDVEKRSLEEEREAKRLREIELKIGEIRNQTVGLNFKTNEQLTERQTLESLSLDRQRTMLNYEQQTRLLRDKDKQLAIDIFNIRAQEEDKIRAIKQETNLLEADREERIKAQNQLAEKAIDLARERNRVMREMQEGDQIKGFGKRAEEFFAFAPTAMENGAQMFDSILGNMTGALDNFVSTGKLSFKDLTRSIIQDMIRIQLRAQMISLFSGMFSKFSGGGFGTGNKFGNQDLGGFLADGGPANVNTPYVVGERGPELFVPRSSGTVIPNNQINNMMGSSTNVTNNYINAIDTKSFEDRLLNSSNAIWAANQYANKSLAVNRGRA
jgi:lambda family phage tail tape measure protein